MNRLNKTIQYLLKYRVYPISIIFFIIIGAALEGFSVGMIIPFLKFFVSPTTKVFSNISILNKFDFLVNMDAKSAFLIIILFIFLLVLLKNIFILTGKMLMWKLRFSLYRDLQTDLFDRLIISGVTFFDSTKSGHLLHSFNRETELISGYMFNFLNLIAITFQMAVYCLILFLISWQFCIISAFLIIFIFPVIHFIRKKKESSGSLANKNLADTNFVLMEILTGFRIIKLFIAENSVKKYFLHSVNKFIKKEYEAYAWQELITPASEVIILGLISIAFIKVIYSINIDFNSVLPVTIAFMWILLRLLSQLNNFNHFRTEMAGSIGALESYEGLLLRIEKSTPANGHLKIENFRDEIEFKNVTFGYTMSKEILKNVNFVIPKGKITAIVGSSGVGKTTVVNLVPRLYDPTQGQIMIDGINLRDIDFYSWRSKIGFVSQEVFIFNAAVRDNIVFGLQDINEQKIVAAAKAANIHDFIMTLPDGYNTILGERGVRLSGGQKQRISIARAIIRDPEILVLDEATSSLDSESERLVQEAIKRVCLSRTVIIIAHRLSTIQNADKFIVMENGKIAEQGTHEDLLKANGYYANLYRLQYKVNA